MYKIEDVFLKEGIAYYFLFRSVSTVGNVYSDGIADLIAASPVVTRLREQILTCDSGVDSWLSFGSSFGREDWRTSVSQSHIKLNQGLRRIEVSKLEIENDLGSGPIDLLGVI